MKTNIINRYKKSNHKYDYFFTHKGMNVNRRRRILRALKKKANKEFENDFKQL